MQYYHCNHHHNNAWEEFMFDAIRHVKNPGLKMEFGVGFGGSANLLCEHVDVLHGFDSFYGLPEAWHTWPIGTFSSDGRCTVNKPNFVAHHGMFEDSLPRFVQHYTDNAAFIHIDCDLYSSTQTVFKYLHPRIVTGTVVVFDEILWSPSYLNHEMAAFVEYTKGYLRDYEVIAATSDGQMSVIFK